MRFVASRSSAPVPTLDTERRAPFRQSNERTPSEITPLNHALVVDIPTGNLVIATNDVGYPYYDLSLGITRRYDAQEQWMACLYFSRVPNVDPRPHWFGNWSFAYQANVAETWNTTSSQLQAKPVEKPAAPEKAPAKAPAPAPAK
jgi:hypothetical protein